MFARITGATSGKPLGPLGDPDSELIVSGAVHCEPGVIRIEHWVGRCLGASGAAAVAAAIGAARGLEVPLVDPGDPSSIVVKSIRRSDAKAEDDVAAVVFADADDGSRTMLEITIPS